MTSLSFLVLLAVVLVAALGIRMIQAAARREPGRICRAPGCDQQNRSGAKYCARCGAPLNDNP
jgi:hypothetical protein